MRFKLILFCILLSQHISLAQTDTTQGLQEEKYFKINYDNDFFSATDRYYTQGTYYDLIVPFIKKIPLSKLLIPLKRSNLNYYGLRIRQDCFTPRSIRHDSIFVGERPYAGVIYLSDYLISVNTESRTRLTTILDIGVMGPVAKAAETQKNIHKWLKNIQPLGWEYQLEQDIVLNYYLGIEKGFFSKKHIEMLYMANARAGTMYDDVSAGIQVRTGIMPSYFAHLGLHYNSVIPKQNKFQCFVFGKGEVKTVVYNATLQGGMFNKNSVYTLSSPNISRVIYTATGGIVVAYKRLSLEYTKVYISPEFKGGLVHGWGHCSITMSF